MLHSKDVAMGSKNYLVMTKLNPDVTKYIAESAAFAKPILKHWRKLIHNTCPEVVEVIKWGIPHFDYHGEMMIIMASYKNHCSFSFWKAELLNHPKLKENSKLKATDRYLGKIKTEVDLPPDTELIKLIKEAMLLNEKGVKQAKTKPEAKTAVEMPVEFLKQLKANPTAKKIFDSKSDSFRKEYNVWISSAKTDDTRGKRIAESLEWIAEGKGRFWQYQKK